jgi:hypothetical protein
MPKPPQHLVDLAHRAHAAGAPAHVLRGHVVAHVQREAAREEAVEHAMALVEALSETPGAPKVKLWTGLSSGAAPRVYFPEGYVTVGADGSIGGASARAGSRGSLTFSEASLYPAQRRAYKKALDLYRASLVERAEEQAMARADWIEELVEALGSEDDGDDEQLGRQAERAAWQARHEEGRANPMRQPADEPGFHFAVIEHQKPGAWKGRIILAAYTDDRMLAWIAAMPARLLGPLSTGSGARRDAFPELGDEYGNDADVVWTVAKAHAWESGWGPLMYEALLAFVAAKGYSGWITSDTMMTSTEARVVWRKFADRADVEFRPGVGHNVNGAPVDAMRALPSLLHARADLLKNADKRANYKRLVKLFLKDPDESGRFL